jgi:hypothetical protein
MKDAATQIIILIIGIVALVVGVWLLLPYIVDFAKIFLGFILVMVGLGFVLGSRFRLGFRRW